MKKLIAIALFAVAAISSSAFGWWGDGWGGGWGGGCCNGGGYGYGYGYGYGNGGCC
jgi:hypothetical protein